MKVYDDSDSRVSQGEQGDVHVTDVECVGSSGA